MRFSKEKREAFNKSFYELLENSFKNINEKDEKGETVLHHAVEISDRKTVRLLIQKGAEINARDKNGYTPLHYAVFVQSLENVKVLIRSGAEVNATQYIGGCAPLHSACRIGAGIAIIKELVKRELQLINWINMVQHQCIIYGRVKGMVYGIMERMKRRGNSWKNKVE